MKKLSILLLVFVLVTALAVSCSAELSSNDSLATISFVDSSAGKSLVASNQNYSSEAEDYFVWYYTATKADTNSSFNYGEKTALTLLGDDGKLSNTIVLSLGYWEFALQAYWRTDAYVDGQYLSASALETAGKTAVYSAEDATSGPVLVERQENGNQTITVTIVNTMTSGQTGKLLLDSNIKVVNAEGDAYDSIEITDATYKQLNGLTAQEAGTLTAGTAAEVYSGTYEVTVSYTAKEKDSDGANEVSVTYASETKIVNVYDGLTTTITGTLDETTQSVTFDFKVGCKVLINQSVASAEELKTGYTYKVSIADLTDSSKTTTVKGTGCTVSDSASFILKQYDTEAVSSNGESWMHVVIKLNDGTKYGWQFDPNTLSITAISCVTVKTYIGTGLTNLKLTWYSESGNSETATIVETSETSETSVNKYGTYYYDSESGYITFVLFAIPPQE